MLEKLNACIGDLRPSERSVADYVVRNPDTTISMSLRAFAEAIGVSEPTVMRFCQALGCDGYADFKLRLAQDLARNERFMSRVLSDDDDVHTISQKVLDRSLASLMQLRDTVNSTSVEAAVAALHAANRIEIYGSGGSGNVALEAQQKLFRLGTPVVAHVDPYTYNVSAALLGEDACVIAVSYSGRSSDVVRAIELARDNGATSIAITRPDSPLSAARDIVIDVNINEDSDYFAPIRSRLAQHVIIDIIAVALGLKKDNNIVKSLRLTRQKLASKYIP